MRIRFLDSSLSRNKSAPAHIGYFFHFLKITNVGTGRKFFKIPFVMHIKKNEKEERMLSTTLYT
jgi:hypothetical protein